MATSFENDQFLSRSANKFISKEVITLAQTPPRQLTLRDYRDSSDSGGFMQQPTPTVIAVPHNSTTAHLHSTCTQTNTCLTEML